MGAGRGVWAGPGRFWMAVGAGGDAKASTRAPAREPLAGWFGVERRLPAHPLIELILGQGVVQGRVGAFAWIEVLLPVRRGAGRGDRGWRCGSPRYSRMR